MTPTDLPLAQLIDVHSTDADPTGPLSVAEIQQAFRQLRQRRSQQPHADTTPAGHWGDEHADGNGTHPTPARIPAARAEHRPRQDAVQPVRLAVVDAEPTPPTSTGGDGERPPPHGRLQPEWIAVVAAHSGAGASCVALAIAEALASPHRPCRLLEAAPASRSGQIAAATAELGVDPTGAWRRGTRAHLSLYRRSSDVPPEDWPDPAAADAATVVDLGSPSVSNITRLAADRPRVVAVCRATVPGVRGAETLLTRLDDLPVVVAAVGAGRWPGEVMASLGPRLRHLRGDGRIVTVPEDRQLQVTGATTAPLPKPVAAAARAVLDLLDTARTSETTPRRGRRRLREER